MANQPLGQMIIELGLDSTTFASGMTGVNQQLKTSMTEMKAHLNVMGRSGSEVDKLHAKQDGLTKVVQIQSEKVRIAKDNLDAHKKGMEDSGDASQKQKDKLINLTNEYNKAVGELGSYGNQLKDVNAKLLALESPIYKVGSALETMGGKITNAGNSITDLGKKMTLGITTPLLAIGTVATKAAIEWESAFAGVKKTVDEVVDANGNVVYSYKEIEDSLLDLSEVIPATTTEIAGVAEAAGQLGIATTDVVDFTTVMLNLGVATNMTAEDAATSLAKIINITGMTSDKYENLGSSIVALGNNMATTEADIVNMSTRMASAGTQAGMTETDILAIAAAMSSLGMESQAGGSAMSRTINKINSAVISGGDSLTAFASTAGMTASEFKDAWEKDAAGALTYLVAGLSDAGKSGEDLTAILGTMEIQSTNDVNAMMALATSSSTLSDALDISGDAWNQNTALATEAETRYATFESQLQMTKSKMNNVAIEAGGPLLTALSSVIDAAAPLIDIFKDVAERFTGASLETQQMIIKFAAIAIAAGPVLTVVGKLTSGIGDMTANVGKGLQGLATWAGKLVASSAATTSQVTATTASTAATQLNTAANAQNTSGLLARTVKVIASSVATKASAASDKAWNLLVAAGNGTLTAQVTALNASIISKTKDTIATAAHTVAEKAKNLVTGTGIATTTGYTLVTAAQTVAVTIGAGAVGLLTAAFKLLTGPVGWIIAGVGALTTGVIALVKWFNKETEASKQLTAETKELATATDELTGSTEESQKAYQDSEASIKAESSAAKSLVQTVRELSAIENKSAAQKQELASYVDMLNGSVDGLNLVYDEQTDTLNMTTDAIYAQIDAFEVQAQKQVAQERLTEILKERIVVNEQLVQVQDKITEAENNTNLKDKERKEIIAELTEQQTALTGELDNLASSHEYVTEKIKETTEAEAAAAEVQAAAMEAQKNATEEYVPTILEAYGSLANAYEDMGERQKATIDGILNSYEMLTDSLSSLSDKIELDSETTWAKIQENQADTIIKTQEFSTLYGQLINAGVSESYLNAIGATGPESIPLLQGMLASGTDTVLASQGEWEAAYGVIGDTLVDSLGLEGEAEAAVKDYILGESGVLGTLKGAIVEADLNSIGVSITEGLSRGILESTENAITAATDLATDTTDATSEEFEINSPSKKFMRIGESLVEGLALGVTNNQMLMSGAFDSVVPSAMEQISKIVSSTMPNIEKNFATGFSNAATSVKEQLTKMTTTISNSLTSITSIATNKINSLKTSVNNGFATVVSNTTTKMTAMKNTVNTGFNGINTSVTNGMNAFKTNVTSGFNTIQTTSTSGMSAFRETIASGLNSAAAAASSGIHRIVSATNIYNEMYSSGVNAMVGFENGLSSRAQSVYARASSIAQNAASTIRKALDIHSPSRVMLAIGEYTMEGFGLGLENMQPYISGIMEDTAGMISGGLDDAYLTAPVLTVDTEAIKKINETLEITADISDNSSNNKLDQLIELLSMFFPKLLDATEKNVVPAIAGDSSIDANVLFEGFDRRLASKGGATNFGKTGRKA